VNAAVERPSGWRVRDRRIALDRPTVVGILNVTPDSFSDGGCYLDPDVAADYAREMIADGAGIIDVGAESTRPGAERVPVGEEWRRLEPVLGAIRDFPVPISVDTTKLEVAERALDAGAAVINDVSGGKGEPGLLSLAARTGAGLVLMHMRGTPRTMQKTTRYDDVSRDVCAALSDARDAALAAGCAPEQVALDPGIGFGKSVAGNLELIARLEELVAVGAPIWIGPSRKSFLGTLLARPPEERLEGTIAACVMALRRGARVFRVHDVAPVCRALAVAWAIETAGRGPGATRVRGSADAPGRVGGP